MPAPKRTDDADPTITSGVTGPEYPEGTHPVRAPSEVHHNPDRIKVREMPDKPDASSVAQVADVPDDWFGT